MLESQEELQRLPIVRRRTGLSRSSIYQKVHAEEFPRPVKLGAQSVAWRKSDIDRWIATREETVPRLTHRPGRTSR